MKHKDRAVREAARAYGALGEKNGVNVHFNLRDGDGVTDPLKSTPGKPDIHVWINPELQGRELQRVIAHEGVHVQDFMAFINSGFDQLESDLFSALNENL